jgi:cytochrome c-type biogenesis protein
MGFTNIGISLAFIAGLASFLSPCVFSLVPAYIGYLGGRSAASATRGQTSRWLTFSHGLAFVIGFSVVFITLGVAASAIGGLLYDMSGWISKIGGIVVIIFGIHMTGLFRIPFLEYDLRAQTTPDRRMGYLSSALMGVFFSAGWSPCVGPILGSILTVSMSGGSVVQGVKLLTAYSAGLAIPFLFAATQIGLITTVIRRYGKVMRYVEIGMGIILIIVGALLFSGRFESLAGLGSFFGAIDEVKVGHLILAIVVAALFLGLIPAFIARSKGRNFTDWWFFGFGLFPVALVSAVMLKPHKGSETQEKPAGAPKPQAASEALEQSRDLNP